MPGPRSFPSPRRALILCLLLGLAGSAIATCARSLVAAESPSTVGPLMRLLESGRLPEERVPTVVEMICKRGNEQDLRVILDRALSSGSFEPAVQLQVLNWLLDAAETRKVRPVGDLSGIATFIVGDDAKEHPDRQRAAIRLAAAWREPSVAPALQTLALDATTAADLRRAAIDSLVALADPTSRHALEQLTTSTHPVEIRMQAVAGLTGLDLDAATVAAAEVLADAEADHDPGPMLDAFFQRQTGPDRLAAALERVELNGDVAKRALRYMYSVGRSDPALSDVLSAAAGIATDTPLPTSEEVARLVADVVSQGDAARGEMIFRRKDLNCMKCHSIRGAGGQIGPDLSAVGVSSPVDYIVNSILNPNLAVKEQFTTRVFFLNDGKTVTGVVIDRDEVRVNVRDVHGATLAIAVADIEEEAEGQSLMPQGLARFLTRDELLDLAKFISELGKPGPYAVQTTKTVQRWRVLRSPATELVTDVPHLEHVRQFVLGSAPDQWDSAYATVSGVLPLAELRSRDAHQVLILQGEVDVRTEGVAAIQVECTEPYTAWLDDDPLGDGSPTEILLEEGHHWVTLRVELSERTDPTLRVELSTPAESDANFVVVGGT